MSGSSAKPLLFDWYTYIVAILFFFVPCNLSFTCSVYSSLTDNQGRKFKFIPYKFYGLIFCAVSYSTPVLLNLDFYFFMPSESNASKRKASAPTSENNNKAVRTSKSHDAPTSKKQGLSLAILILLCISCLLFATQRLLKKRLGEQFGPIEVKVVTLTS